MALTIPLSTILGSRSANAPHDGHAFGVSGSQRSDTQTSNSRSIKRYFIVAQRLRQRSCPGLRSSPAFPEIVVAQEYQSKEPETLDGAFKPKFQTSLMGFPIAANGLRQTGIPVSGYILTSCGAFACSASASVTSYKIKVASLGSAVTTHVLRARVAR